MKALIVDDEKHVREAIRLLVPWSEWGIDTILEAADGEKAIEWIEQERPELIFTDMMMPAMGGVELLRWMHEHEVPGKTIVISGYDDFELARHTVRYGGRDYILKPIEPDQLMEAVERAISEWRSEEEHRSLTDKRAIEINQLKPVYWDKAFSQMIDHPEAYYSLADALASERGLPKGTQKARVAVLPLEGVQPEHLKSFSSDEELFYFAVTNICNEILGETKMGYAFSNWSKRREVVMVFWDRLGDVEKGLARIQGGFERTLRLTFHFGLGSEHAFPGGLKDAYQEAVQALQQRNLLEAGFGIHRYAPGSGVRMKPVHLSEYNEALRMAIYSGNPLRIRNAVHDFIQAASDAGRVTPEQLQMWHGEYKVLCSQWAKSWFDPLEDEARILVPGGSITPWAHGNGRFSLEQWEQLLTEDLVRFGEVLHTSKQQTNNVIYEIKKYVESHYQQEISLQDIANHFFLSREYISRKFKQELHENLSDYVGRIRIEKAQKLLENPSLKVVQVSQMVGYQDEKYFSKVFKKLTGLSPNEYRKAHGTEALRD